MIVVFCWLLEISQTWVNLSIGIAHEYEKELRRKKNKKDWNWINNRSETKTRDEDQRARPRSKSKWDEMVSNCGLNQDALSFSSTSLQLFVRLTRIRNRYDPHLKLNFKFLFRKVIDNRENYGEIFEKFGPLWMVHTLIGQYKSMKSMKVARRPFLCRGPKNLDLLSVSGLVKLITRSCRSYRDFASVCKLFKEWYKEWYLKSTIYQFLPPHITHFFLSTNFFGNFVKIFSPTYANKFSFWNNSKLKVVWTHQNLKICWLNHRVD